MNALDYERSLSAEVRRRHGRHYTPASLTAPVVEFALRPLLADDAGKLRSFDEIAQLRICDPAVGPGAFLEAVAGVLIAHLHRASDSRADMEHLRRYVWENCLYGMDLDEAALAITRQKFPGIGDHLRCGDALLGDDVFGWQSFDAVVGNPPFVNAIDTLTLEVKTQLRKRYPQLGGTADLAYYFVELADHWTRPEGTIGLVLPRAFLAAPAARKLRERLLRTRPPKWIECPSSRRAFARANVRVLLLGLGGPGPAVPFDCSAVSECAHEATIAKETLGDHFEIFASMTTAMAYDLRDSLEEDGEGVRLLTTGLIDPQRSLWGEVPCRYLHKVWQRPSIRESEIKSSALLTRLQKVRRAKVIVGGVAGPGDRVEAMVDEKGIYCGAVSTFTILEPQDNLTELRRVCEMLNGPKVREKLQREWGAMRMGSGLLTVRKDFLRQLPWESTPTRRADPSDRDSRPNAAALSAHAV